MSIVSNQCIDTGSRLGTLLWVEYHYTFGNGYFHQIGPKTMPSLAQAEAECVALIATVEADVAEQFRRQAAEFLDGLPVGVTAESVIPDFPDELPASDADVSIDTRRRGFHRWLVRWVWPHDLLFVERHFLDVWTWLEALSAPNLRTYLDVDVATGNEIGQRMGNALTVGGIVDADVPGELI